MSGPVLFLDIDGVLHPFGLPVLSGGGYFKWDLPQLFLWRPLLESALEPHLGVSIVVSSSWRYYCEESQLRERVLGPRLADRFIAVTGSDQEADGRADEILRYAEGNRIDRWVAIDDDPTVKAAEREEPRFIWCPPDRGIAHPTALMRLRKRLQELTK